MAGGRLLLFGRPKLPPFYFFIIVFFFVTTAIIIDAKRVGGNEPAYAAAPEIYGKLLLVYNLKV